MSEPVGPSARPTGVLSALLDFMRRASAGGLALILAARRPGRGRCDEPGVVGIVAALMLGKPSGVFGAVCVAIRSRIVRMPERLSWRQIFGAAMLCGIGFTMSLFVGDLSFHGTPVHAQVKLAVFAGSLLATFGLLVVRLATRGASPPG